MTLYKSVRNREREPLERESIKTELRFSSFANNELHARTRLFPRRVTRRRLKKIGIILSL